MQQKKVTKGQIGRIVQLLVSDTASFADAQAFIARHPKKGARKPKTDVVGSKAVALAAQSKPLGEDEYLIHVNYVDPPLLPGKVRCEWRKHPSCAEIVETSCDRIMLIKSFGYAIVGEDAIAKMNELGYRPATNLEAYAFQMAKRNLQRQIYIVALGSFTFQSGQCFRMLNYSRGEVGNFDLLACVHSWSCYKWDPSSWFLFVRKDPVATASAK